MPHINPDKAGLVWKMFYSQKRLNSKTLFDTFITEWCKSSPIITLRMEQAMDACIEKVGQRPKNIWGSFISPFHPSLVLPIKPTKIITPFLCLILAQGNSTAQQRRNPKLNLEKQSPRNELWYRSYVIPCWRTTHMVHNNTNNQQVQNWKGLNSCLIKRENGSMAWQYTYKHNSIESSHLIHWFSFLYFFQSP